MGRLTRRVDIRAMGGVNNMAFALLIIAVVSGIMAAEAGMREAEEASRLEHLKAMRRHNG